MFKKLSLLSLATFAVLVLTSLATNPVRAYDPLLVGCNDNKDAAACRSTDQRDNPLTGPNGTLTKATNLLAVVAGVVAVVIIIIAGIRFITSSGDPSTVTAARNTILYAVIGLIAIVVARTIIVFVVSNVL